MLWKYKLLRIYLLCQLNWYWLNNKGMDALIKLLTSNIFKCAVLHEKSISKMKNTRF